LTSLHTLDNGLRLAVHERPGAPVVSIYLWFEVGSADESEGLFGAAHVVEHMLFKGSALYGVGEAASEIEGLGGDLNAYTTFDQTVLHATVMAAQWRKALDIVLDMAISPRFDPVEFAREKLVILEEVRGALGEPDYLVDLEVQGALFPGHGYGRPILGTEESVTALEPEQVKSFWRANYTPDRAVLSVAGPVGERDLLPVVTAQTAGWKKTEPRRPAPAVAPKPLPHVREIPGLFATRSVQLGWEAPAADHPDLAPLDILIAALAQGRASILNERLEIEHGIAHELWGYLLPRLGAGAVTIGFSPLPGREIQCLGVVREVLERVAAVGLGREEFERTRDAVLADFLFAEETMDSVAHDAAWYTARLGSPGARERYRQLLAETTTQDIQRVAQTYLSPRKCALSYQSPGLAEAEARELIARPLQLQKPPHTHTPATPATIRPRPKTTSTEAQRVVLDDGTTIILLPDQSPVASLRLIALGGGLIERSPTAGTRSAWSRMLLSGAGERDAISFARAVEKIGGDISGIGGRNTYGLSGSFPAENIVGGIHLCADLITRPSFDRGQWHHVHAEMREHLLTLDDRPSEIAGRALNKRLWRGHPWALPGAGSLSSMRRITCAHLRRVHRSHFHGNNVVIAVSGGFDSAEVLDTLSQRLQLPSNPLFPGPRGAPEPVVAGTARLRGGHEQSTVLIGYRAHRLDQPERFALEIACAILGTQGGRLFMDLRERHSLAYSVWAQSTHGLDGGQLVAGLATEPSRTSEAIRRLRGHLHALAQQPPTPEELERSKNVLKGHAAMGLQRTSDRAAEAAVGERLGIRWGFEPYCTALDRVTSTEVSAALCAVVEAGAITVRVDPRST
jgi:zinc protease